MATAGQRSKGRIATLFTEFAAARAGSMGGKPQTVKRFTGLLDGFLHARQRKSKVESKRTVRFAELLQRYGTLQVRTTRVALAGAAESAGRFKIFAEGFREARRSASIREAEKARGQRESFARVLEGHTKAIEAWEKGHRFVTLLAEQFDDLAELIPAIDSAVGKKAKADKL